MFHVEQSEMTLFLMFHVKQLACIETFLLHFPRTGGNLGARHFYCESEGWSREDNDSCKPRCLSSRFRTAHPHHRLRSTGKYNKRPGISKRSCPPHPLSSLDFG